MTEPQSDLNKSSRWAQLPFFYGWVVVAVAFVSMGIGVSSRTAFSLLFPPILDEFGWERGVTAAAFSIGFISSIFYAPAIGSLMDRWGARYIISLGAILVSSGMMLATQISSPWQLYLTLGVLVVGGSICMSYIGHGVFLPNWFVKKRGLAVGIAFSGVGVGSILMFPWLQGLIDNVGWREACWSMAILLLVVLVPLNLIFQRQRPEELGLLPDGEPAANKEQKTNTRADNVVDTQWASTEWTLRLAMKRARFWWVFFGFFFGLFAWYAIQVHQTKYLIDIGFASSQAAFALGLVPLLGIIGQIGVGHLSDRLGREWAWTIGCLGFALCFALLLLLKQENFVLVYTMVAVQGLLGYGMAPAYAAIPAELFQSRHYGKIFGVLSVAASLGPATGPWVTGVIYDHQGSYTLAFWLSLILSLLSMVCIWMAAPRKVRVVAGQVARLQASRSQGADGAHE